jgi:hypothetical protein
LDEYRNILTQDKSRRENVQKAYWAIIDDAQLDRTYLRTVRADARKGAE